MAYTELKEKLERLLTEDLSNRSSLQDVRRNLFLNSEGAKVQQQLIAEKQGEISSLNLLVEKKKTILQLKDEQINTVKERAKELEEKLTSLEVNFASVKNKLIEKITGLEQDLGLSSENESKISTLSIQNEEFAAKIRELIFHIDGQNTELATLKQGLESKAESENKISSLTLQNEELSAKILGLISQIDSQNTELATLKLQAADKTISEEQQQLLDEKIAENGNLQERNDLLFASEQQLKVLVASQNNEIEGLTKQTNGFKKQTEDIAAGWQIQQDQLIMDNANLLAELMLVKEAAANVVETAPGISSEELTILKSTNADLQAELELTKEDFTTKIEGVISDLTSIKSEKETLAATNEGLIFEITSLKESASTQNTLASESLTQELASLKAEKEALALVNINLFTEITALKETASQIIAAPVSESLTEEQIAEIKSEKAHLATELDAIKHELNVTTQNREEKIISLQNEIGTLQNQLISLSNSLNQETEEKNLIGTQLEQLTNLVTEKEQQLNGMSNNKTDEEFVDKLMHQLNFLSNEKNSLETLYHDSVAELNLTKANLASITQLVDGQKDSISDLEETNKHVKLAQTLVLQAKDKTEAKQAINELVREIDRCIALLSE
jgi:chromosome segregation ATPase